MLKCSRLFLRISFKSEWKIENSQTCMRIWNFSTKSYFAKIACAGARCDSDLFWIGHLFLELITYKALYSRASCGKDVCWSYSEIMYFYLGA